MLSPTDLALFEILDEFIDKSLTFGCKFMLVGDTYTFTRFDQESGLFKDKNYKCVEDDIFVLKKDMCNVLGHYPTLSVFLRYCIAKKCYIVENTNEKEKIINTSIFIGKDKSDKYFVFDLTKELQYWSEGKKQKLLAFLKSL